MMEQAILTPEHQACKQHFITHTTQRQNGRFMVRIPLKEEPNKLRTSRRSAEHRTLVIERKTGTRFKLEQSASYCNKLRTTTKPQCNKRHHCALIQLIV